MLLLAMASSMSFSPEVMSKFTSRTRMELSAMAKVKGIRSSLLPATPLVLSLVAFTVEPITKMRPSRLSGTSK